jgi:hypothetical protein
LSNSERATSTRLADWSSMSKSSCSKFSIIKTPIAN